MWRIVDWNQHYENAKSREVGQARWVPVPNKQDGDGYLTLLRHADGPAHYGCFIAIVLLASKCPIRGELRRTNGLPHTVETIAEKTHMSAALVHATLSRCQAEEVDWIEWVDDPADEPSGLFPVDRRTREERKGIRVPSESPSESQSDAAPSARSGNGSGTSSTTTTTAAESAGEGSIVLMGPKDEPLVIDAMQISELVQAFPGVDVPACLADLALRQQREPDKRRPAAGVPKFVRNWLKCEQTTVRQFPKVRDARASPTRRSSVTDSEKRARDLVKKCASAGSES